MIAFDEEKSRSNADESDIGPTDNAVHGNVIGFAMEANSSYF